MSNKNNRRSGKGKGVVSAPELTGPWGAILAGLRAVRGVVADKDAIEKAVGVFTAAGETIHPAAPGTPQTGRFTGGRIMSFQDLLYGHNMQPGWGFTDAELAVAWKSEFPTAKCDFAKHHGYVGSARGDLNRNRRGTKIEQLNAQFGFTGPVAKFTTPVPEPAPAKVEKKAKATA